MLASSSYSPLHNRATIGVTSHPHRRSLPPPHMPSFQCRCHSTTATATAQPLTFQYDAAQSLTKPAAKNDTENNIHKENDNDNDDDDEEEGNGISKIRVPRQKYVPVSKSELLDSIVSNIFPENDQDIHTFLLLSKSLDSILHAEHKSVLEEMRSDYFQQQAQEDMELGGINGTEISIDNDEDEGADDDDDDDMEDWFGVKGIEFNSAILNLRKFLPSPSPKNVKRFAVATRFQRAFMQLLDDAQFEELSARDLTLTSALNTDYLLTLPIFVDWKRASESNAIIFRRGYATERQNGLLIVEKLDYLQSKLLRGFFYIVSKPLGKLGSWITEGFNEALEMAEAQDWVKQFKVRLKELILFQQLFQQNEETSNDMLGVDQLSDTDLPIWIAAQRAVSRYEGFLSPVGPRGRLLRKLLIWSGIISPTPETPFELDGDTHASEPYKRPNFLSRITLGDIWRPATTKYCGNDVWKKFKTSVSIFLSQSILQEPAFEELILLYTNEVDKRDRKTKNDIPSLQLKIYERIPIPDLPVVFPHKKLSFRIIDTVRLDVATILGLSAFAINYKFEDVLSSPSAIVLDVVAVTALIIYVSRIVLGYKQTWDRYQLLVNRTLYEKTIASGFGAVHFILDASEQQQYKEAILSYAVMLKMEGEACRQSVRDQCERFLYDVFKVKVEMPVDKAINTLLRLGLATESFSDGKIRLGAISCSEGYEALKRRWNTLIS